MTGAIQPTDMMEDAAGDRGHLAITGSEHIDYPAKAKKSKEKLEKRLIRASQPEDTRPSGPTI